MEKLRPVNIVRPYNPEDDKITPEPVNFGPAEDIQWDAEYTPREWEETAALLSTGQLEWTFGRGRAVSYSAGRHAYTFGRGRGIWRDLSTLPCLPSQAPPPDHRTRGTTAGHRTEETPLSTSHRN